VSSLAVRLPEHCPESSFCVERGGSEKMHTLPRCRGELVFGQGTTQSPHMNFFSFCVCMHVTTLGKHTSTHGSAPSDAELKHKVGKFEIVWRLFRASHSLICAFNDYYECTHQEFLRFGCRWQQLEGQRSTCNTAARRLGTLEEASW